MPRKKRRIRRDAVFSYSLIIGRNNIINNNNITVVSGKIKTELAANHIRIIYYINEFSYNFVIGVVTGKYTHIQTYTHSHTCYIIHIIFWTCSKAYINNNNNTNIYKNVTILCLDERYVCWFPASSWRLSLVRWKKWRPSCQPVYVIIILLLSSCTRRCVNEIEKNS